MKSIILAFILLFSFSGFATDYYISATGNDSNSGLTSLLPKQTITAVNALTLSAGDRILFKKGDGWYGTLTANYSGTAGNAITYGTYGTGASPTITGFTTITSGWTDEGGGIYSKVITSESQTNVVTIDGVQYGMGRYPNATFLTYESASTNVSITDNQLTGTPDWTGAEALIYKNGYRIDRATITNHTNGTLTYTSLGSTTNASATQKYFIQNDLRTLDTYGEWYHDYSGTGKFYMYFGAVDPATKTVKVATLNYTCKAAGSQDYVTFDGLSFTGAIKQELLFQSTNDYISLQNCSISFCGRDGFYLSGTHTTVNNTTFNYCGRISIYAIGANATITNNTVTNNATLVGQGNYGTAGLTAIQLIGDNATATGNTIQNAATNGIYADSSVLTGLIKNNYIYNVCVLNWDHGAIYTNGDHTALTIESNVIDKSAGNGIYLDATGSNVTVKNNTVNDCALAGIFNHQEHHNTITGNVVYNSLYGIEFLNATANNTIYNITFSGNIVVAKSATQKAVTYYTEYASHAATWATNTFTNNVYARPIDDNLTMYYNSYGDGNLTLAQWKTNTGVDASSGKSPVAVNSESGIQFMYNETNATKIVALTNPSVTMAGVKVVGSVTLQPYTSAVYLKDPNPLTPAPVGHRKAARSGTKYATSNGYIGTL